MKKLLVLGAVMGLVCTTQAITPSKDPENLVSQDFFTPQVSWVNPSAMWGPWLHQKFAVKDGILELPCVSSGYNHASIELDIAYECADAFEVTFEYQTTSKSGIYMNYAHPEKRIQGSWLEVSLPKASAWTRYRRVFRRSADAFSAVFGINISGQKGMLRLRNLRIRPLDPKPARQVPSILLAGQPCLGITYSGADAVERFYNCYAAKIIRSELYRLAGVLLPLTSVPVGKDGVHGAVGQGIIHVGGPVPSAVRKGGYALTVIPGRAVVRGARPSGMTLGAVALLKHFGIDYLTRFVAVVPERFSASPVDRVFNPAIPFRMAGDHRFMRPEILGYSTCYELGNERKLGSYRGMGHSMCVIMPYNELGQEHPDFFALQPDGKRLKNSSRKTMYNTQYCVSNPELQREVSRRMIEWMRSEPHASMFSLGTGDGGGRYCRCERCQRSGVNLGERNIGFINAVARETGKVFPDCMISTSAYVDTRFPPQHILPLSNVVVKYCPYAPVWMNHLITDHPANAQGIQDLHDWEKVCPRMGAFVYPSSCRERFNVWPAFYANYAKFKHFAEKKYLLIMYCGMNATYSAGSVRTPSFGSLYHYVLSQVLRDPKTDVEKEIDHFMSAYYGKAGPAMRRYFNLLHQEVRSRNWEQNTEHIIRGFVTPKLASACYDCFQEAEGLVQGEELRRVKAEKLYLLWSDLSDNCRGNGKITTEGLPDYARKLAEYCVLSEAFGANYNTISPKKWFWDTAMLRLGETRFWYRDPMVKKLVADPVNTLLKALPDVQKKTDYGYFVENQGILGGERSHTTWLRPNQIWASCMRRPSSGFGTAQLNLNLEQAPKGPVTMKIDGIDCEKELVADMEIKVNGHSIFKGKVPWGKESWRECAFEVPAGILKKGRNGVVIMNLTADTEKDGVGGVNFLAKRNYYWGWFMFSNVKFVMGQ